MSVLHKAWKTASDTISCKIISLDPPYLLSPLPNCQAINQPHLHIEAIVISKRGLGTFRIGLCLHVKQNGTDFTKSNSIPPADAEQSVLDSYRAA